jgi:hypothetical protein
VTTAPKWTGLERWACGCVLCVEDDAPLVYRIHAGRVWSSWEGARGWAPTDRETIASLERRCRRLPDAATVDELPKGGAS